jgi:eukaryotic-like serine/threonine-protein kinase
MEAQADPLVGTLVSGRYRVIKPLGEGGMGKVYLAEHEAIEKKVALKVLHGEYSRKEEIVTRFQQEAISASRIKHPNVLDVFDFGRLEDGSFFLAMEFLEGNDLADDLQRHRVLDPVRGLRIALQICRALQAAHSKGVVHRDMKPENVFLQRTGDGEEIVKIVDFGIAQLRTNEEAAAAEPKRRRLTKTGMIFGTPEYMAPEQAAGRPADQRADIYACGVILYEVFTSAVPFTGDSFLAVLTRTLQDPVPPMNQMAPDIAISPEMQAAILRALAKSPDERYQSMTEFAQALMATPEGSLVNMPQSQLATGAFAGRGSMPSPMPGNPTMESARQSAVPAMPAQTLGAVTNATGIPTHQTQLTTGGTAPPVQKSSSAGVVVGLSLGLLAVLGGAGFFVWRGTQSAATAEAPSVQAPPVTPPTPTIEAPKPVPSVVPSTTVAVATEIHLKIETEPPGATVTKDGFQVCDLTPCEVVATPNETLELQAKKGALVGKAKVLAQRDQNVKIALAAPVAKPVVRPSGPRMCEVEVDGLKILRPCP